MKILFFVHRYWPHVGGVERYVQGLARALRRRGHDVDVVTGAHDEGCAEREVHEDIEIHRFPAFRSPLRSRLWLLRNRSLFQRADVIQVSDTHMLEYLWRMIGVVLDRRKVFLTRHGMSFFYPVPQEEKRRAKRALSMASGLVHDGAFIEKWLGVKPDACPDQGLDPPADRLPVVPEPEPESAVYIGRLEPDTGMEAYVEAVQRLGCGRCRSFRLDVYGEGSLGDHLKERVRRDGLNVRFHGSTPDAQERVAEACFAFLDGRMAIQEAMARRRLVFAAYNNPLKHDYLRGERFSGHLIAVQSAQELADRVSYFADQPRERQERVTRAFEYARGLTWERTAEAFMRLWEERLGSPVASHSLWTRAKWTWALSQEALPA